MWAKTLSFATENGDDCALHSASGKVVGSGLNAMRCGNSHVHDNVDRKHQLSVRVENADVRREGLIKL
eukprot:TsM_000983100 transcript=TsM_000983100 gene=TsM_000983100